MPSSWHRPAVLMYPAPQNPSMDPATIRRMFSFARAEEEIISGFDLRSELFVPLILSIRSGGDWSYAAGEARSVSVVEKTTVYDESRKQGRTREEIYLVVSPEMLEEEGAVSRLEKCGEEETRLLVTRPYRVKVRGERVIRADVDPLTMEIPVHEIDRRELTFTGSAAYGFAHEMEHMAGGKIIGTGIYEFTYRRTG
jgi:predicted metalloprotease